MKKIIIAAFACIFPFLIFSGCNAVKNNQTNPSDNNLNNEDKNNRHIKGEVKELLTVEQLVEFHDGEERYPEGFIFEQLEGYGRVLNSAESQADAHDILEKNFNSGWCRTVENKLIIETDLFYGMCAKWAYQSEQMTEPTYYDEYVVSFKKNIYDVKTKKFGTKNADEIKNIIDYVYYSKSYNIGGSKVYSSEISVKDNKYEYVIYKLDVSEGDFGIQDCLMLTKCVHHIDSETGIMSDICNEMVGEVFIDGAGSNWGGVV